MADNAPNPAAPRPSAPKPAAPRRGTPDAGHVPITEEMDSAKWTLPPIMPVVTVIIVLAAIIGIFAWVFRAKPAGEGAVTGVFAVQIDPSNVMVEVRARVLNVGKKQLWIRNLKAKMKTDGREYEDDAASTVDFQRYFQAFPDLAQHQSTPLVAESKIPAGAQQEGMIIVAFPVSKEQFDKRESLSVIIEPYDQRPVVIAEVK
jgi:hypothetical protein